MLSLLGRARWGAKSIRAEVLCNNGRYRRTLGKRECLGDPLPVSCVGNETHDCEELSGVERILDVQSGVKEFEDLGAPKVKEIFGMQRENVQHLHPRGA